VRRAVILAVVACTLQWKVTEAADFRAYTHRIGNAEEIHIVLEGKIELGDDQRLSSIIAAQNAKTITDLYVFSPGGVVPAAAALINIVRRKLIHVRAPAILQSGSKELPSLESCTFPDATPGFSRPLQESNCICASACSFIWLAAPRRSGTEVYVHRPHFDPSEYKTLPLEQAQEVFDKATAEITNLLFQLSVPRQIIEKAFSRASLALSKLTAEERQLVGEFSPAIEELLIARCGDSAAAWAQWEYYRQQWESELTGRRDATTLKTLFRALVQATDGRNQHLKCRNEEFLKLQQEAQGPAAAVTPELEPPAVKSPANSCEGLPTEVAGLERCLKPGDTFRDCNDCPEMVVIPAGSFMMGSPTTEPGRLRHEGPQHRRAIEKPIAISKFEITFGEWQACISGQGCAGYHPMDEGWGGDKQPVVNVSWSDASDFVDWLTDTSGVEYRLLSEVEWEYAARGGTTTPYSTGWRIKPDQANFDSKHANRDGPPGNHHEKTLPVGTFNANAFGLYDMHGNVWEWVKDCSEYLRDYQNASSRSSAVTSSNCYNHVIRGGCWNSFPVNLRSAARADAGYGTRNACLGFRIARNLLQFGVPPPSSKDQSRISGEKEFK
jgi:formylglycine-generating enzyme required for sulfatase activity